jgi:predicted DNA-binding transcriptional regulator YafY
MSLTGYRTLVILDLLMESPKSVEDINDYFMNNQYIKEKFSNDTIRIYINSLRAVGCKITRANKSNENKYELLSHPFDFEISKNQLDSLLKLYKNIYEKVDVKELVRCKNLFEKIYPLIKDQKTRSAIQNMSALKNIDCNILNELIHHCNSKNQIIFLYKSPKSGEQYINLIADKLSFKSEKLYIWGHCLKYNEYSYFRLDRIIQISTLKLKREEKEVPKIKVVYELYNETKNNYTEQENETILATTDDSIVVEEASKNKFELLQKILYMGPDCKIIYPDCLKRELLELLNRMEESYK